MKHTLCKLTPVRGYMYVKQTTYVINDMWIHLGDTCKCTIPVIRFV